MPRTTIVSIHSFRGGTGKSNITANVASQVALLGKRVAIIDTDIQSPGIHVPFGLNEDTMGRTLNDYLHDQCAIEDVAFHIGSHTGDSAGRKKLAGKDLWLLPSSINGNEISRILKEGYSIERLNEGMNTIRKKLELDYLFIDTHPGLNEETLLSIALSDVLLLVMRPDQQDFQGTSVTADLARGLDVPNLFLVINKALRRYDWVGLRANAENIFHAPVAGILPLSEDVAGNESADVFSLANPESDWSTGLKEVVNNVLAAQ